MNRSNTGMFVKGIATGMAVGTAVGMIGSYTTGRKRNGRKTVAKAVRAVSEIAQNVQYMLR